MDIATVLNAKNVIRLGGLLLPILVIGGLLLLWVAIVIVCLNFGQAFPGGNMLVR
jgi:hypothetical protein